MRATTRWFAVGLTVVLLAACGAETGVGSSTTSSPTTTTTIEPVTSTTASTPTTTAVPITTVTQSSTTSTSGGSGGLPGESVEFGPSAGDTLAVVGVAYDDVLNLRSAPGADQEILATIPPLFDDLTALGDTRELRRSFWIAVDYQGTEGWVNLRYTGYLGKTTDVTPEYVDGLTAADMVELGMKVAEASGYDRADLVVSSAPTQGDPGEITVDLLGLEDDSVRGARFHVVGRRIGDAFALDRVESTAICVRGVDGDGFCV